MHPEHYHSSLQKTCDVPKPDMEFQDNCGRTPWEVPAEGVSCPEADLGRAVKSGNEGDIRE